MGSKIGKTPNIRFTGFTDPWEKRKLGELAVRITRKNKDLQSTLPLTISAQDGLIDQNEFFNKTVASRDVSGYYLVKNGEFAYNKSYSNGYPWGAVKRLDRYEMGVLSTLYIVFKPTDIDSDFLSKYYDGNNWHKEVSKHAAEGARNHGLLNIAATDFFETELTIPLAKGEQQQIGLFFNHLDKYITIHQRRLDLLKVTKKSMLQKMFPQDGKSIPEIRFAGFTDEWESRSIAELADRYDNLRVPITAADRIAGSTPYYGANGIQDYVSGFTHDGEFILIAEDGASDLKDYPIQYVNGKVWVNNHAHVLQAKDNTADNKFLMNAIKSTNIEPFLVGGGRAKLNADVMMKIILNVPKFDEQVKIGAYFNEIDNIITLHNSELDILKNLKKSMLQQMFI